jgi:hypothetical protein
VPWFCWVMWWYGVREPWCSLGGLVLVEWLLLPWDVPTLHLLAWLAAVVLPAANSVRWLSCLWAACVCVTQLWSDPLPGRGVLVWLGVQRCCTKVSKEQILHLIKNTQWWNWQDHLPKSESKTNSNPFLLFYYLCLMFILQVIKSRWRSWRHMQLA